MGRGKPSGLPGGIGKVTVKVRELSPGKWYVMTSCKGVRRARKMGSKKSANLRALEIQEMIDKGKFNLPTDEAPLTLAEYAEKWMAGHVEKNLRPSTYDGYRHQLDRHILPALGHRPLAEITRVEVKEFAYRKIEEGLSGVSVRDYMRCLSSIMNHAKEDGLRTDNPAEKPGRFVKAGRPGENAGFLTPEESRQFLISMATHFPADVPLLLTFLRTGLRRGELLGLQWADIDLQREHITVSRSIDSKGRLSLPKNGRTRKIDVSRQLFAVLYAHRRRQAIEADAAGRPFPVWVFPSSTGTAMNGSNLWDRFQKWIGKAGIRKIRLHDLRHSFVSQLLASGAPPSYVKEQAGHSSIQITVDVYGHAIPGANRGAINALDDPDWEGNPVKTARETQMEEEEEYPGAVQVLEFVGADARA